MWQLSLKGKLLLCYAPGRADNGWPPFRRGFALCSIISHYYMSHLLPRIPMGEDTHIHSHTHTYTYRWYPACLAPIIPKSQKHTLAPSQESSLSRQPSPTSTTRWLLKRKNHLNDTDETACHTAKQKSLGAWGNTLHPLWHYKTVEHELRTPGGNVLAKAYGTCGLMVIFFYRCHAIFDIVFSAHFFRRMA